MLIKLFSASALAILLLSTQLSNAETRNLNDVIAKATAEEMNDLPKLLKQIRMKPTGDYMMEVTFVEKGSVYDRQGVKVGDLFSTKQSGSGSRQMVLKQSIKETVPHEPSSKK